MAVSMRKRRGVPGRSKFVFFPGRRNLCSMLTVIRTYARPFSIMTGGRIRGIPFLGRMFGVVGTFVVSHRSIHRTVGAVADMAGRILSKEGCLVFPRKAHSGGKGGINSFGKKDFGTTAGTGYPVVPMTLISSFGPFSAGDAEPIAIRIRFLGPVLCRSCGSVGAIRVTTTMRRRVRRAVGGGLAGRGMRRGYWEGT